MYTNLLQSFRTAKGLPRRLGRTLIPKRAQLPLTFWWQNFRRALEPELLFVLRQKKKSGIAIDVGANQGLYSYALAKLFDHVEAFEPNSSALLRLSRYASEKITIHNVALSRVQSDANLYIPTSSEGVEYAGWGSLHREMLPPSAATRIRTVSTRSLDSYGFHNVGFMKIDVEGHEMDVLEGAPETIARCRPLILIEVKPKSRSGVWSFFNARQYHCFFLSGDKPVKVVSNSDFSTTPVENFFWSYNHNASMPEKD